MAIPAFERVVTLEDEDRVYAEEAIEHYLPRPLYFLTSIINRLDSLNLTPERRRALNGLLLVACDAGNTLWDHPSERRRPKQLNIPAAFREHNLWLQLEQGLVRGVVAAQDQPCVPRHLVALELRIEADVAAIDVDLVDLCLPALSCALLVAS